MVLVIHAYCILHNLANAEDLEIFEPPIKDDSPDPEANNVVHEEYILHVDHERGQDFRDELCHQLAARQE